MGVGSIRAGVAGGAAASCCDPARGWSGARCAFFIRCSVEHSDCPAIVGGMPRLGFFSGEAASWCGATGSLALALAAPPAAAFVAELLRCAVACERTRVQSEGVLQEGALQEGVPSKGALQDSVVSEVRARRAVRAVREARAVIHRAHRARWHWPQATVLCPLLSEY
jgi:hypothetical protein